MSRSGTDKKGRMNKTLCLRDELDAFMRHMGLDSRMHELKILDVWKECVGESIASYSKPVQLRKSKLLVSVENAAWRYELSLNKEGIIENLNKHLKKDLIKEIIFV